MRKTLFSVPPEGCPENSALEVKIALEPIT